MLKKWPLLRYLLFVKPPVHVLQRGVDVNDIVIMAAIAVLDPQDLSGVR